MSFRNSILARSIATTVAILTVLTLPWWVGVVMAIVFLFIFDYYMEAVLLGLILDGSYGSANISPLWPGPDSLIWSIIFTLSFALLLVIIEKLKRHLSFY